MVTKLADGNRMVILFKYFIKPDIMSNIAERLAKSYNDGLLCLDAAVTGFLIINKNGTPVCSMGEARFNGLSLLDEVSSVRCCDETDGR